MPNNNQDNNKGLRELAKYLGAKIDTLAASMKRPQEFSIDVDKKVEGVPPEVVKQLSDNVGELNKVMRTPQQVDVKLPQQQVVLNADEFSVEMANVAHELTKATEKFAGKTFEGLEEQFKEVAGKIGTVAKNIKAQKPIDLSAVHQTNTLISSLIDATKGIKLEEREIDLSALDAIKSVLETIAKKETPDRTDEVIQAVQSLEFPTTFKLDETQLRSLRQTGGGGGSGMSMQDSFNHGSNSSVGATAGQMTSVAQPTVAGVIIKADNSNAGIVYVGDSNAVTAGGTDATDGFQLAAGESITVPIYKPSDIWLIASQASQKVYWVSQ